MNQTPVQTDSGEVAPTVTSRRRIRRVRLRTWIILLVILFSPFLILVSIRQYRIWQVPLIPEPLDVEVFLKFATIPQENDALLDYEAAASQRKPFFGRNTDSMIKAPDSIRWEDLPTTVQDDVVRNEEAYQIWLRGTGKLVAVNPDSFFERTDVLSSILASKDFVDLAKWKSVQLQDAGDLQGSWDALYGGLRFLSHISQRGSSMDETISTSLLSIESDFIHRWAEDPRLQIEELKSALQDIHGVHESLPPISLILKQEYLELRDPASVREEIETLLNQYPENQFGEFLSDYEIEIPSSWFRWGRHLSGEYEVTRRLVRHVYANWLPKVDSLSENPQSIEWDGEDLFLFSKSTGNSSDRDDQILRDLCSGRDMLELYLPSLRSIVDLHSRREVIFQELELMLSLQIYIREQGSFPESLDKLIPRMLSHLSTNPYDRNRGPLLYKTEPDRVVIWTQGEYVSLPMNMRPYTFRYNQDVVFYWTVYPPGTRPPLYRPLPEEAEQRLEEVPPGEGK